MENLQRSKNIYNKWIENKHESITLNKKKFNSEDDVIVYYLGGSELDSNSIFWSCFPFDSAIKNNIKIQIYTTSITPNLNEFVKSWIFKFDPEQKNIAYDEIDFDDMIKHLPISNLQNEPKRNNTFSIFNVWIILNSPYKTLNLMHNDTIILNNNPFDFDGDISTSVAKFYLKRNNKKDIKKFTIDFPKYWNVYSRKYKKEQFHNGFLRLSEKSVSDYKEFLISNKEKLIQSYSDSKYFEQEILKVFSLINNMKVDNSEIKECRILTWKEDANYMHLDSPLKHKLFDESFKIRLYNPDKKSWKFLQDYIKKHFENMELMIN